MFDKFLKTDCLLALVTGIGLGVTISTIWRRRRGRNVSRIAKQLIGLEDVAGKADDGRIKLVLVVRNDLKMGKGKVAAQCSHAAVLAFYQAVNKDLKLLQAWMECGQPKMVLKTEDQQSLLSIKSEAAELGLMTSLVRDAGHTQVPSGTVTVLGIGPAPVSTIDQVTGSLKLY